MAICVWLCLCVSFCALCMLHCILHFIDILNIMKILYIIEVDVVCVFTTSDHSTNMNGSQSTINSHYQKEQRKKKKKDKDF